MLPSRGANIVSLPDSRCDGDIVGKWAAGGSFFLFFFLGFLGFFCFKLAETRVEAASRTLPGSEHELRAPLVVSFDRPDRETFRHQH